MFFSMCKESLEEYSIMLLVMIMCLLPSIFYCGLNGLTMHVFLPMHLLVATACTMPFDVWPTGPIKVQSPCVLLCRDSQEQGRCLINLLQVIKTSNYLSLTQLIQIETWWPTLLEVYWGKLCLLFITQAGKHVFPGCSSCSKSGGIYIIIMYDH